MPRRKTQAEVLEQFRAVHGDRYDYSQVAYSTSSKKVDVICLEHGLFSILPGHHINGVGCRTCYFETQTITKAEVVRNSKKHFGDRYDYSSFSELPSAGKKVKIFCTAHDLEFLQEPRNHQRGHVGCLKCKSLKHALGDGQLGPGDDASKLLRKFIKQARAVHGDRYGYEEFEYVNVSTKGRITCPLHGNFYQTPNNHLKGRGCPECTRESLKEGTFKQKCEKLSIDYWRALKRRQAGMSEERLFSESYVRATREVGIVTVHGVTYPNMEEVVRALSPPASSATISRWIASGLTPEEAFSRVPNPGYGDGIVYVVTHGSSHKQYVGITVQSLNRRWEYHLDQARAGYIKNERSLHAAIRKFGAGEFTIEQIDTGSSKGSLEAKERKWIKKLGTLVPHGFNISTGGTSGGSNSRSVTVDGITFSSVKAATEHLAQTRQISLYAAAARIRKARVDVRRPAKPGESLVKTPAYKVWSRLIHGVMNPKSREYIPGVEILPEWKEFDRFLTANGQPPSKGMAFARLDKSKGYVPENCKWMSKSEASKINAAYMKESGLLVGRRGKGA
jgi:hypothetical protein